MNKEQSVTLLRMNKRKQVDALNSIGFQSVNEGTRASTFPDYIKWAGGLLDVRVAVVRISDGAKYYLTIQEWESLSNENKTKFVKQGVRIRACQEDFMLASTAIGTFAWGGKKDVTTIKNYGQTSADNVYTAFQDVSARELTERIASYYSGVTSDGVTGAPAAEAALAYKAFSEDTDGVDDDLQWCLMKPKHGLIIYRYLNEINDVIKRAWSSDNIVTTSTLWTCMESGNQSAWIFIMSYGGLYDNDKLSALTVRPIAEFTT